MSEQLSHTPDNSPSRKIRRIIDAVATEPVEKLRPASERHEASTATGEYASKAADIVTEQVAIENPDFTTQEVVDDEGSHLIEHTQLDPEHAVDVVLADNGMVESITVSASDETGETHTVTVEDPDHTPHGEVFVDDEPVDEATLGQVEAVMRQTAEDLESRTVETPSNDEASEPEQTRQSNVEAIQEVPVELQYRNALFPYLRNPNAHRVMGLVAKELEMDLADLKDRLQKGDIHIDEKSQAAMTRLGTIGAKPNSPLWNENPNAPSQIGAAVRESNALLAQTLRELLR